MLKAPLKDLYYNGAFTYSIKGGKRPKTWRLIQNSRFVYYVPASAVILLIKLYESFSISMTGQILIENAQGVMGELTIAGQYNIKSARTMIQY